MKYGTKRQGRHGARAHQNLASGIVICADEHHTTVTMHKQRIHRKVRAQARCPRQDCHSIVERVFVFQSKYSGAQRRRD